MPLLLPPGPNRGPDGQSFTPSKSMIKCPLQKQEVHRQTLRFLQRSEEAGCWSCTVAIILCLSTMASQPHAMLKF